MPTWFSGRTSKDDEKEPLESAGDEDVGPVLQVEPSSRHLRLNNDASLSSHLRVFLLIASLTTALWQLNCLSWRVAAARRVTTDGNSTTSSKCESLISVVVNMVLARAAGSWAGLSVQAPGQTNMEGVLVGGVQNSLSPLPRYP